MNSFPQSLFRAEARSLVCDCNMEHKTEAQNFSRSVMFLGRFIKINISGQPWYCILYYCRLRCHKRINHRVKPYTFIPLAKTFQTWLFSVIKVDKSSVNFWSITAFVVSMANAAGWLILQPAGPTAAHSAGVQAVQHWQIRAALECQLTTSGYCLSHCPACPLLPVCHTVCCNSCKYVLSCCLVAAKVRILIGILFVLNIPQCMLQENL